MTSEGERSFTVLDWIGVVVTAIVVGWLVRWPFVTGPAFSMMFQDMGGGLPAITLLALSRPLPLAAAALTAVLAIAGILAPASLGKRRTLVVAGFTVGAGASALLLYAVYAPIFQLAGTIK